MVTETTTYLVDVRQSVRLPHRESDDVIERTYRVQARTAKQAAGNVKASGIKGTIVGVALDKHRYPLARELPLAPPARPQKEPWEMKRGDYTQWYQAEWRRSGVRNVEADWIWAQKTHEMSVKDAIKDGKPVPAEVLKDYPELERKDEPKPATAPEGNLDHAYYDWTSHNAYWGHNGYHLKTPGKPYAPWNKAVKAKYGDDNGRFHDDAVAWAKAHNTSNLPSIQRLQWDEDERSSRGSKQDRARSNKITVEPYDPRVKQWRRDHGSMDIEGIDTKVTIRTVPEKERTPKEKPQFRINRKSGGTGRGRDLGADIVKDRRGRHLRL